MNESTAACAARWNSCSAIAGRMRALEADHRADERVDDDEQRELREVRAEARAAAGRRAVATRVSRRAPLVEAQDRVHARRASAGRPRAPSTNCVSVERAASGSSASRTRSCSTACRSSRRRTPIRRSAPGSTSSVVGQREQLRVEAVVQLRPRSRARRPGRSGRPTAPTNSVSPVQDEPRLRTATEIGDDEADALGRVPGRVEHVARACCRARSPGRRRAARTGTSTSADRGGSSRAPVRLRASARPPDR